MFIQVNEYLINTNTIKYIEKYDGSYAFGIRILFIGDSDCDIQYKFEITHEIQELMDNIEREKRYIEKKLTTQENIDNINAELDKRKKKRDDLYSEIIKNCELW